MATVISREFELLHMCSSYGYKRKANGGAGVTSASTGYYYCENHAIWDARCVPITGMVTGRTVIDFCKAPIISHLLAMKDFVQEITILDMNSPGVKEIEKWKNKDPDAFDWSHVVGILKELKGNRNEMEDEEEDLRGKLKNILHLEHCKGIDSLLLPKADITTSMWFLDVISKDHDEYRENLRKLCNIIQLGGYLLICTSSNCSYFKVGEHIYHVLSSDESFFRKVISEEGFDIKHFETFDKVMSCDSADHEGMVFIIAHKVKEPQEASWT
ncbi:nicotinamide N-methyltransferase-like [Eleutherodactylus coqui]|uniref:nicotinamide N-methyltransferase-like n=1 Tax=Eleutherodactylus coqui TaxID=57060 RepID=UPI003462D43F